MENAKLINEKKEEKKQIKFRDILLLIKLILTFLIILILALNNKLSTTTLKYVEDLYIHTIKKTPLN